MNHHSSKQSVVSLPNRFPARRAVWTIAVLLALFHASFAQQASDAPGSRFPQDFAKRAEAIIESERAKLKLPSVTVAVAYENKLVYSGAFGLADMENSVVAKPTTVYRTGSIAKPITAAAVMKLAEAGKLNLDAPIQKYCPAFPEKPWPVTARLILGHLSGIRHYVSGAEATGARHFFSITESLDLFKNDALLFEPGARYNYTTFGYTVLGCAIEGASGRSYETFLRENVLVPAGMDRTMIDELYTLIPDRARGYQFMSPSRYDALSPAAKARAKPGEVYNADLHDTSMKVPGGGILSTSADLVKFAIAMNTSKLLAKSTVEQMWTPLKLKDGSASNYGLGWGVGAANGARTISHTGSQAGTATALVIIPERGIAVAAMTNMDGVPLRNLVNELVRLAMGAAAQ